MTPTTAAATAERRDLLEAARRSDALRVRLRFVPHPTPDIAAELAAKRSVLGRPLTLDEVADVVFS